MEWKDIESAPKGRVIILYAVTERNEGGRATNYKMETGFYTPHVGENETGWNWEGRMLKVYDVQPTHWHPLPEPPPPLSTPAADQPVMISGGPI